LGVQPNQKLQPVEPVGVILEPIDFKEILPREWILEKFGIDPLDYPDTNVSGTPAAAYINENLKNLTGRQSQGIERIIRKYKSGRITKPMAETMLRSGLGLNDNEISTFLNFARIESEDEVAEMFSAIGKPKSEYVILKQKQTFNGVIETMPGHEEQLFKDLKQNDSDIVNLIGKDKRITPEVIAKTIHESVAYVRGRIEVLKQAGVLTESIERIGPDTIIEHAINPEQIDKRPPPETADVFIRYSYEPKPGLEPLIKTSRPFCIRLIELDRLYTRGEIESISQRVGFSVWDRKGGFWGDREECRHRWVSNIVIKKRT
jgi:DNA-binding Lrp family transcriptional regulator